MSTKDYIEKDYYKALGVAQDASAAEIKKVYRKLARELHPDKNPGDAKAEARFKDVSEAYDVLSDPAKRKEYDEARSLFGAGSGGGFGGFGGAAGPRTTPNFDVSDLFGGGSGGNLNDLFDGLFGANAGRGSTRTGGSGPVRGQDVTTDLTLAFDEAVHGVTMPLRLSGPASCKTCGGSGARPGTAPHRCPNCGGSGFVSRNQGAFGFSEPCVQCRGTGQVIDDPCPDCHGSGTTTQVRTINVRIPAGVRDGAKIRVPGKGTPGRYGAPAGDLFVAVHVEPHKLFGRSGDDLTLTVPITFAEAALGSTLRVPTLDGSVALKIAPGTPSGRTLRVRGRGVQARGRNGDLLVTVEVAVPAKLNGEARSALEQFAAAQPDDPRPEITAALNSIAARGASGG
ncbi:MAG: molecular chaperone DnaJ [Pseudonocardiales bacterium]|jgi:molecular chaperone DnaJ|nr:molecular chaperone DnaJ [Pseudonocardiales bacterium]